MLLFSCSNDNADNTKFIYFNLSKFIDNEAKRLSELTPEVEKTVFLNGKEEIKTAVVSDWNNELNAFREADINKKSFLGKYEVDSVGGENYLLVKYSTPQESFRTKELAIQYDPNNKPVKITATVATNNVLYSSRQELVYEPGTGYSISGKQSIRFLEPDSFSVNVLFGQL